MTLSRFERLFIMAAVTDNFSNEERNTIIELACRLTGSNPQTGPKIESCLVNIQRRMQVVNCTNLKEYLERVEISPEEQAHFISAVTIHTTSWFREMPHFERLRQIATQIATSCQKGTRVAPLRILSAGSSSGEEAYSMGIVLEEIREQFPNFNYQIEGWDVDPVSVAKARRAIYGIGGRAEISGSSQRFIFVGSGKTDGFFTLDKNIRSRCEFHEHSLLDDRKSANANYDIIFCRNVLIYFNMQAVQKIISKLVGLLSTEGILCLGHSESVAAENYGVVALGNATYQKIEQRQLGLASSQSTRKNTNTTAKELRLTTPDIIVIGASTGGTEVLVKVVKNMPSPCPPVIVVQHISSSFAVSFAERLAQCSGLTLGDPRDGLPLQKNHLYMALGDYHIAIVRRSISYYLQTVHSPPIHSVRPAVDILFQTAAKSMSGHSVMGIILTGMGKDGAVGLKELHDKGAMTFAQDEASCTVFGMPREAIMLGAAKFVGDPAAIRKQLLLSLAMNLPDKATG
jgi:chemotaxis protein methyltransferase CheR